MFDFKNASKAERQKEYNRIAKEIGDDQFFTKKELHYLPEMLREGEQVLAFTSGLMDGNTWLITLTDRRIIFLDKGMIFGLKQTTIPLDKVNAVSGSTGIIFGKIHITHGSDKREIDNVWKKTVRTFTNKVQEAIENLSSNATQHEQSGEPEDKFVRLEKLAGLKERGLLTESEYQAEKRKLLDT